MRTRKIKETFYDCNVLEVEVEHNGYQGGDAGHGGYVTIRMKDHGCTTMEIDGKPITEFEITFRGTTERQTLLSGLEMIVEELKNNIELI